MKPHLPDDPQSKVNLAVENIHRIWDATKDDRLTQLVFAICPRRKTVAFPFTMTWPTSETAGHSRNRHRFIQDYDADNAKLALFRSVARARCEFFSAARRKWFGTNVRNAWLRFIIWIPVAAADVEQRKTDLRQGNKNSSFRFIVTSPKAL